MLALEGKHGTPITVTSNKFKPRSSQSKILVIFLSVLFFLPFMITTLITFTQGLATRIVGLG